jgi:hypothetical protein
VIIKKYTTQETSQSTAQKSLKSQHLLNFWTQTRSDQTRNPQWIWVLLWIGVIYSEAALAGKESFARGERNPFSRDCLGGTGRPPMRSECVDAAGGGAVFASVLTQGGPSRSETKAADEATEKPLPNYTAILKFLTANTTGSQLQIEGFFKQWIQTEHLSIEAFTDFLAHTYFVQKHKPHRAWNYEAHNLKIIAQSEFILDELGAFLIKDPDLLQADTRGLLHPVKNPARKQHGSFKTIHKIGLLNRPKDFTFALSQVKKGTTQEELESYEIAIQELEAIHAIQSINHNIPVTGLLQFLLTHHSPHAERVLMISPFYNRGDAYERSRKAMTLPRDQLQITSDLLKGLTFLHDHGFAHRDIKPSNILLQRYDEIPGQSLRAVLADFGTTYQWGKPSVEAMVQKEDYVRTTYSYAAPETVEKIKFRELKIPADQWATHWTLLKQNLGLSPLLNSRWNPAWTDIKTDQLSDLWSLGISLLEITSGQHLGALHWLKAKHLKDPSDLKPNDLLMVDQEKVDQVLSALGQAPLVDLVEAQVVPIIRCLLRVNPEERCSAKEALQSLTPP